MQTFNRPRRASAHNDMDPNGSILREDINDKRTVPVSSPPPTQEVIHCLTPANVQKIKREPNLRGVRIELLELPKGSAQTRGLYKDVLNTGKRVTLESRITTTDNLWCLGLGFTTMDLNLSALPPYEQIRVIKAIRAGIKDLSLGLRNPNQQVLDAINSRLEGLERLAIVYREINSLNTFLPCLDSLVDASVYFETDAGYALFKPTLPFKNLRSLELERVEFSADLARRKASFALQVTQLDLLDCRISKPILDLHFASLTELTYHIPGAWEDWDVARDLVHLHTLRLILPDSNYPVPSHFPHVSALRLENLQQADLAMWHWLEASFPAIETLSLKSDDTCLMSEAIPARGGLPKLQHMYTTIHPRPSVLESLARFAPKLLG